MNFTIIFLFMISLGFSKEKYPADSLIKSPNISFLNKIGLLPNRWMAKNFLQY